MPSEHDFSMHPLEGMRLYILQAFQKKKKNFSKKLYILHTASFSLPLWTRRTHISCFHYAMNVFQAQAAPAETEMDEKGWKLTKEAIDFPDTAANHVGDIKPGQRRITLSARW